MESRIEKTPEKVNLWLIFSLIEAVQTVTFMVIACCYSFCGGMNMEVVLEKEKPFRLCREELLEKPKEDLVDFMLLMERTLARYLSKTCGAREAAEMFNRKKTWIYDALSRPRTELQREIAQIASRLDGKLVFRVAELEELRRRFDDA